MNNKDSTPEQNRIDQFNRERFDFYNSGFVRATEQDYEVARQLSLRMLESAIRLQQKSDIYTPPDLEKLQRARRNAEHIW